MKGAIAVLLLVLSAAACRNTAEPPLSDELVTPPSSTTPYTAIDLGTLGGAFSSARDINVNEQIVGESQTAAGETHAFLFADGVMQDLGTLGGAFSAADDINDAGQIAGRSTTATGEMRAVLWTDGTLVDLGPLVSDAVHLSQRGQAAWSAPLAGGASQAALWSDGVMQELGTLGGPWAQVAGINDLGDVVGISTIAEPPASFFRLGFVWRDGLMTALPGFEVTTFGGSTQAHGINRAGQIVGRAIDSRGQAHAVLWQPGEGTMTDLGTLQGDVGAAAIAINDLGWVAGESYSCCFNDTPAPFRWQAGVMLPLDREYQTNFNEQFVAAMNGRGVVVGREEVFNRIDNARVWEHGVVWDLGTLGGESADPVTINDSGTVVGRAMDSTRVYHAVAWRRLPAALVAEGGVAATRATPRTSVVRR